LTALTGLEECSLRCEATVDDESPCWLSIAAINAMIHGVCDSDMMNHDVFSELMVI